MRVFASADGIILSGKPTDGAQPMAREDSAHAGARAMLATNFQRLPLHALHVARGGKIVPFAGYDMPVHYAAGVMKEHLHTRAACGLFDISHMGMIALTPKSGRLEDAARALRLRAATL